MKIMTISVKFPEINRKFVGIFTCVFLEIENYVFQKNGDCSINNFAAVIIDMNISIFF